MAGAQVTNGPAAACPAGIPSQRGHFNGYCIEPG